MDSLGPWVTFLPWRPPSPDLSRRPPGGNGGGALQPRRRVGWRAGGAPRPEALGRQYRRSAEALVRGGSAAGGGRDPDTEAAGTRVARRGASNMSSKCDVVVVGGGISGQWRLRALFPPPRAPTSGRSGRHAGRPCGGVSPGAPRLSVRRRGSRGSQASHTESSLRGRRIWWPPPLPGQKPEDVF